MFKTKEKTGIEKDIEQKKTGIEQEIENKTVQFLHRDNSSDLIRAIELLHSPDNLESNTILTNEQVNALSLMNWASQVYEIQFFKHFISLFPRYRISGDDGRGRKEIIQIAEAIQKEKMEQTNKLIDVLGRR